jgi:crotonobetainyl-CoA:carnitine CoA-transferase CaiB-like acyl-CoA transferase
MNKISSALQDIRVLECAGGINGPSCGCILGCLGAEVIKIEKPGEGAWERGIDTLSGTGLELPYGLKIGVEVFDHSKKSITLDLEKERGRKILYQLVKKSDVFLTNYHRSALVKLGADYQTLSKYNPQLIYATSSALGSRGSESERRAFDYTGQARSGMMTSMGDRDEPPTVMVGAPADQLGAIMLAFGILAAIIARERTGYGQEVDTSMAGAAIYMQAFHVGISLLRSRQLARHSRLRTKSPLSNYYKCADSKWLILTEPQVYKFWPQFCRALGLGELVDDPRFNTMPAMRENAKLFIPILDKVFATKTRDQWINILDEEVGLAFSPVLDISELATDPQVLENECIVDFDHPALGRIKLPGLPIMLSKTPAKVRSKAPELGEHTEEVLIELCEYSWEEIAELSGQGVT